MLHVMFLGVLALSIVIYFLAPWLVNIVAAGFAPADREVTVQLMRILLLSPLLMSLTAVFISIQDSEEGMLSRVE